MVTFFMDLMCAFGCHNWTKWRDVYVSVAMCTIVQHRECAHCGKKEKRIE